MAKFNGIYLHVETESANEEVNVPEHPVQSGIPLSDHVERQPQTVSLSGKILGTASSVDNTIKSIKAMQKEGKLGMYSGRAVYYNMAVISFKTDADANIANGFNFSMELKEIRLSGSAYKPAQSSAKPSSSAGLQQTQNQNTGSITHIVKKGDTYWALARKYGTTWKALQKLNGTDPKLLQIGQKLKIK